MHCLDFQTNLFGFSSYLYISLYVRESITLIFLPFDYDTFFHFLIRQAVETETSFNVNLGRESTLTLMYLPEMRVKKIIFGSSEFVSDQYVSNFSSLQKSWDSIIHLSHIIYSQKRAFFHGKANYY